MNRRLGNGLLTSLKLVRYVVLAAVGSTLGAAIIPVTNPSFETLPGSPILHGCGGTCAFTIASENAIPGWNASLPGNEGQFNPGLPGTTTYYNSVPDGSWIAYANVGNLTQVVSPVTANTLYTLTVALGLRKDFPVLGTAELFINGAAYTATGVAPTSGNWSTFTATYNSGLHPADVGLPITIELISNGVQAGFDNVALNAVSTAIPEPGTLMLIGVALMLFGLAGRLRWS